MHITHPIHTHYTHPIHTVHRDTQSVLAGSDGFKGVLQCVAVCCNVLQCVAVCCSVLQCAAVCCTHTAHSPVVMAIKVTKNIMNLLFDSHFASSSFPAPTHRSCHTLLQKVKRLFEEVVKPFCARHRIDMPISRLWGGYDW